MDGGDEIKTEKYMKQDKMKARMRRGSTGRDSSQAVKYNMCREKPYNSTCHWNHRLSRDPSIKRFCYINSSARKGSSTQISNLRKTEVFCITLNIKLID